VHRPENGYVVDRPAGFWREYWVREMAGTRFLNEASGVWSMRIIESCCDLISKRW
jgi:hypothetical protein